MIFGSTVGYDSIYSYPFAGKTITAQEMRENFPLYDSEIGKSREVPENMDNKKPCDVTAKESELVKALYSSVNKSIYEYIMKVLNKFEYAGSPIYQDDGITRETLAQAINQVIESMKDDFDEIEEILLEFESYEDFSRNSLLYFLVQALILNEIFLVRRPKFRRIKDNYVYVNGIYDGIKRR